MALQFIAPEDDDNENVAQDSGSDQSREQVQPGRGDEEGQQAGEQAQPDERQEVEQDEIELDEEPAGRGVVPETTGLAVVAPVVAIFVSVRP